MAGKGTRCQRMPQLTKEEVKAEIARKKETEKLQTYDELVKKIDNVTEHIRSYLVSGSGRFNLPKRRFLIDLMTDNGKTVLGWIFTEGNDLMFGLSVEGKLLIPKKAQLERDENYFAKPYTLEFKIIHFNLASSIESARHEAKEPFFHTEKEEDNLKFIFKELKQFFDKIYPDAKMNW
jgi:hypothetical protein